MHKEILTKQQQGLLPWLKLFAKDFGLVGGTAIALQISHRQSVDFDLFTNQKLDSAQVRRIIVSGNKKIEQVFVDQKDEYTVLINSVRFTFLYYPFKISFSKKIDGIIKTPDLLTLAAMKAYALGRRAKWKDYVDLYFVFKNHHNIKSVIKKAKQIFGQEFNEKIFRSQLIYFKDIDYSEKIVYLPGFEVEDKVIQKELIKISLE